MTRRKTATLQDPKTKKASKKHARRVRQAKINKLTREILANIGPGTVIYGENPPEPKIVKVDLGLIKFDDSYQRGLKGIVSKIATNFNYGSLGMPVVVKRADGFFYVIDGRQRITAIMERNKAIPGFMTHIWCELVLETDAEARKEAMIFIGRNQRANMSLINMFKASFRARDKKVVEITKRISLKGISVEGINVKGTLPVTCVSSILWAYNHGVLEDSIDAIKGTWGLAPNAFQVMVFMPIAVLLHKNKAGVSMKDLVSTLSTMTPTGLDAQAGSTNGRKRTVNIANFIVSRYNKSVPQAHRLYHIGSSDLK